MEKRKGPPDEGADLNRDKDNDGDERLELLDVSGTSGQNQLTSPPRTTTASNVFLLRSLDASMMGNSQTGFVGFGGGERVIVMDSRGLNFLNSWSQGSGLPGSVHSQQLSVENLSPLVSLSSRGSRAGGSSQMPHFVPPGTQGNFPAYPGVYGPACPPHGQCGMPFQNYPAPGPSVPYGPGPYGPTSLPDQVSQHPYDFQGPQQYIHSQGYHDNIQGAPMRGMPPQSYNYGRRPGPGFTADPNANTARYGFPYAANHHQQGFWQNPHGAPPQGQPNVHQQGPMPRGPTGNPPGYQQPKTIRIDTQVDPKFLKLYFANETNGGGKIDGDPVDHRSSGGYVLITFLNAEVAGCLLSRPHRVKGENLRVSLHHETHSETNRTVVVSGPPKLIADEEYLELYFTNREESSGGAVDGIEYDQKDQVTRIEFKDASVAKAVLDQEQHTLDGQRLVVGTSVPKKTKAPAPQPKLISERRAPAFSPRKPQPVRTAQQQGYSSVTQPKQKAPSVSPKHSPTTPTSDKRNTVVHETRQTHAPSTGPRLVVCVRGLDLRATSHDTLFLYFENKRRSGVEQVSCMVRDYRDNVVYISFPTEEDTTKVFSGSHTLDDQKLDVSLGKMPDVMTKTLAARDLPQDINLTSLQDFIQTKTGQTVVSIDDMEGVVLLKFQRNIDLATTQSTLRNELFDGHTILVDPLLVTNKVMVCGLPKTPPVTKQAVEDVFSPFARVIQTELAPASGKAVITLQNAQAAETVVGKTLSFRKHALGTYLFFDRIGMEFQSTVEPVPSQPDLHEQLQHQLSQLSLHAVQREVTRQPQQANHIQEVKVTSGAPFNPPSQFGLHVPAEARQTKNASDSPLPSQLSETFPATNSSIRTEAAAQVNVNETIRGVSLAKQRYCKEKKIGQEFVDRGLKVHYNTDHDCIELEGKEKDVAEMREVVEMTRDFLQTATHTWDAHLPLEILRSEAVEKAIREACRKEGLDGAIAFTADGFEVAVVYDLQQATRVRDMAAELLITKAVNTSGTDDGDPNQKARWKQLVSSLQRQNENKVILRENLPSQLLVMGIRETVDDTVKKLEEFLAEHSVAERTFPLPQGDTETLFLEFLGQAQTHLIKDNNIEVKDGRVVVKGNKDVIQTADKLMKDFERNLATIRKKINEPSIQRLTQTPEWKRNCQDIESQHKCKISPENDHSGRTPFAAAPTSPVSDSDVFPSFTNPMARLFPHGVNRQRATGGPVAYKPRIHLHKRADITKDEHQLLVNSTKQNLELNSGKVSRALLIAGGQRIQDECYTKYPHGINIGDVAITEGGKLYCKKLAHCCLPSTLDKEQMKKAVKTNVTKCLEIAEKYQLDSVAFPAIGTGTLQYPPDIVAKAMYEATLAYGLQNPGTTIDDVSFVLLTEDVHNHAPFQAEHKSYEKQLSDSASDQDDKDQNVLQTLINPSAQGVQRFDYFSRTKETATFRITALSLASANAAAAELQKCYHDNVKTPSYDTQHLERWDNLQRNSLLSACKQVHVDVTLNYNLNRIELRGFLSDLDRIRTHEIIKEAEQDVHERQHALLMSKQVQWSRIDVGRTGDILTPYDPLINYRIEMAYINKDPNKMLGATYIDFAKWKELPETPGDPNHPPVSVHRHSITEEMAFENPQHWKDMGINELDLVPLQENNPEYEKVETAFRESVKHPSTKIVRIERVQNTTLHKQYMALKAEMRRRVKDCERTTLWHGTKEKSVDGIVRFGFNRSYSGGNKRTAHGQGVYFATEASYSCHNQYAKKDSQGQRRLFLCKALVGKYVKGHKDMRVADHNVFDSAVDDVNNPGIFVIFKDVQAYPEYLIICKDK